MKVAIVHDDLVQWGGAERVLEGLTKIYPDAPIFTSVFDRKNRELNERFGHKKIITSFLQRIPGWKMMYKALLPLYPTSFEQFDFDGYDLVISHTTRFAKAIITKPQTKHVCYCHTPPRFLWHLSGQGNLGLLEVGLTKLRVFDVISARRVDYFLAGSKNAQNRIKKIYRAESKVVCPFIDLDRFKDVNSFEGGYFLVVSRLNKYKRVDLAIKACQKLKIPLKIIGSGPEQDNLAKLVSAENSVEFLGSMEDKEVVQVMAGCKALLICGEEDFGLVSLEAQALGKPVIAFSQGGAKETIVEGKTGLFFSSQTEDNLIVAIEGLKHAKIKAQDCKDQASEFSFDKFDQNFRQAMAQL